MLSRLSMPNLLAVLIISAASASQAKVGVTAVRQPGASLDTSLRNELEHAVDLAAEWLRARQNPDGSWGSPTNRMERTAVALLALTARRDRHSDACARAALWLGQPAQPPEAAALSAHAWRLLALLNTVPDVPGRTGLVSRLLLEAPAAPPDPPCGRDAALWREALAAAGLAAPDRDAAGDRREAEELCKTWPAPLDEPPSRLWPKIRALNRAGGLLLRQAIPLDWRRELAQRLISTQRREPAGGASWPLAEGDNRITQTAFALLLLLEL